MTCDWDNSSEGSFVQRLATAFLNAEIAEASRRSLLTELEEAKETIARLNVSQAKSAGWEARLNSVMQERDDLQQELDSERQRAKNAEASVVSLKDRCGASLNQSYIAAVD